MKKCIGCNKQFHSNYKQAKFCSDSCRYTPCIVCGKMIKNLKRDRKTCSNRCKGIMQKETNLGENNPNFGNKWSNDKKLAQSELIKSKVNDEYRFRAGSANRGKKFSKERIEKMHGHRTPESYGVFGIGHTEETKKVIGKYSKEKWTDDFKKKFRETMENNGNWIPIEEKSDLEVYYKECEWLYRMFDIVENGLNLVEQFGVFHNTKNKNGVVRDHKYGRKSGFENKIFPELLRHPANCEIIRHSENISKGQRGVGRKDTSITMDQLFHEIINYYGEWPEQEMCIEKIKEYKNGKRWKRKEAKCVSELE